MKALVYTAPNEVGYHDEPDPPHDAGDVLIRVEAVGICGSDMHAFHGLATLLLAHHGVRDTTVGEVNPLRRRSLAEITLIGTYTYAAVAKIVLRP